MARRYLETLVLLVACEAYAAARYVGFGRTPADHLPAYVTNKAIALAGLILLGVGVAARQTELRRFAGLVGFGLTGVHVVLSLAILSPDYLPALFRDPRGNGLTFAGETALLAGAVALAILAAVAWPRGGGGPSIFGGGAPVASVVLLLLVALHELFLGAGGWWTPGAWPGGLPPITLLSFLAVLVALLARVVVRRHP